MDLLMIGIGGLLVLLLCIVVYQLLTSSIGEDAIEEVRKAAERDGKI